MSFPGAIQGFAGQAADRVTDAIRTAASRTGIDFSYLMAQARVESGLNPQPRAPTSSARGLAQFTHATWLKTVRKHGAEHGLGWAADAIVSGAAGAGSAARATILELRDNAEAAALMAGEFARDNAAALEKRLGRAAGATDLYMAHFLGAGGAARFLGALAVIPEAAAATLLPATAAANRSVFFDKVGHPRTLAQVYDRFAAKIDGVETPHPARQVPPSPTSPSRREVRAEFLKEATPADTSRARMACMLLAELGG